MIMKKAHDHVSLAGRHHPHGLLANGCFCRNWIEGQFGLLRDDFPVAYNGGAGLTEKPRHNAKMRRISALRADPEFSRRGGPE